MKDKKGVLLLAVLVLFLHPQCAHASTVHFRMDMSDGTILIGEQTILNIYAFAEGVPEDEGIISWGFDLLLDSDEDGIVQFVTAGFEHAYDVAMASFPDDPYTGMVNLGTVDLDEAHRPSQLGIGASSDPYLESNYTLLAQVTVEGIGEGTITYDLGGPTFYSELESESDPIEQFRSDFSSVEIQVIPEPATAVLLMISAIALRYRRK